MRDILILLILALSAAWGYFLVKRLDGFLHANFGGDDAETDDEEIPEDEEQRGK